MFHNLSLKDYEDAAAAIDNYIQDAVIERYVNDPYVLENTYPGKSVLGNIGDFFGASENHYSEALPINSPGYHK